MRVMPFRVACSLVPLLFLVTLAGGGASHAVNDVYRGAADGLLVAATAPAGGESAATPPTPSLATDPRTAGMEAYDRNELDKAATLLREAAALDPNDVEVIRRLGFALKETGRYEEALEVLERVVAAAPDDYYHWWWLSDTQRLLGRYAEALKSMERSLRLATPDLREELQEYVDYTARLAATDRTWENAAIHVAFAERHRANRRVRRQIAELATALSLCPETAPDDREGQARKANICQQLGIQHVYIEEPEVAVDWFSEAARLAEAASYPGDRLQALKEWAGALWAIARQQPDQAVPLLKRAAECYTVALGLALEFKDVPQERQTRALLLRVKGRLSAPDDPDLVALRERNAKEVPWKGPVNEFSTAEAVMAEAELRAREGDYAGARILLEMAMPYYDESTYLADYHRFTELQLLLSNVWTRLEQPAAALECVEKARKKAEEARKFIDFDAFNRGQGAMLSRHMACAGIRAMAAAGGPGDPMLTAAEQAFERALYYQARVLLSDDAPRRDVAGEAMAIRARLPLLEARLTDAENQGNAPEAERLRQRIARDRDRLAWIDGPSAEDLALLRDYRPAPVLGGERFRKSLAPGVTVLHLLSDPYGTMAVLTTAGESVAVSCPLTDADAVVLAARLQQGGDEGAKALEEVRKRIVDPVMERARERSTSTLVICADPWVGQLPLNALFESVDGDKVLIRATRLAYASQLEASPLPTIPLKTLASDASARSCPAFAGLIDAWVAKQGKVVDTPDPEGCMLLAPTVRQLAPDPLFCRVILGDAGDFTIARLLRDKPWKAQALLMAWNAPDGEGITLRSDLSLLLSEVARVSGCAALLLPGWQVSPETAAAFYAALAGWLEVQAFPDAVALARQAVCLARPGDTGYLAFTCWGMAGVPGPAADAPAPTDQATDTESSPPGATPAEAPSQREADAGNTEENPAVTPGT